MPSHAGEPFLCKESIIYDPAKGVRGVLHSVSGSVIYDSGWISTAAGEAVTLNATQEFMEVNNGSFPNYGGGYITYDAPNARMNFRSHVGFEGTYAYRMDGFVDSVALRYNVGSFFSLPTYTSEDWHTLMNGAIGQFAVASVTQDVGGSFFVESQDRTKGIRVGKLGTETYYAGSNAVIGGTITTDSNGERQLVPTQISTSPGNPVAPLAMTNKAVGGASSGMQVGVTDGVGLNNIGLYVRVCGRPALAESASAFLIDDGSGPGVRVQLPVGQTHSWTSETLPGYVTVLGAVGLKKTGSIYERTIYIASFANDVLVIAGP